MLTKYVFRSNIILKEYEGDSKLEDKKVLNFDVPPELYQKVKDEADRLGLSTAGLIRMLIVKYFEGK